jgi:hypothetical protein
VDSARTEIQMIKTNTNLKIELLPVYNKRNKQAFNNIFGLIFKNDDE